MRKTLDNGLVILTDLEKGWSKVPNTIINDNTLSLSALGLLAKLLSLGEGWNVSLSGLAACCRDGRDRIRSALEELIRQGFVYLDERRDERGRYRATYIIFDHRATLAEQAEALVELAAKESSECLSDAIFDDVSAGGNRCGFSESVNPQQTRSKEQEENIHTLVQSRNVRMKAVASTSDETGNRDRPMGKRTGVAVATRDHGVETSGENVGSQSTEAGTRHGTGSIRTRDAPSPPCTRALTEQEWIAADALMLRSLNRNLDPDEVKAAYLSALARGYAPPWIAEAYEAYIERYRLEHPETTRWAMRLVNWLSERGDGIDYDMAKVKRRKERLRPTATVTEKTPVERREEAYARLAEADPAFREIRRELSRMWAGLAKASLMRNDEETRRARDRVDEVRREMEAYFLTESWECGDERSSI
jgi:predicted transcriptional regulator